MLGCRHKIQYLVGAPITMNTMLEYDGPHAKKFSHRVEFLTAGSPPPPSVMVKFKEITGIDVCPAYGLTEVYGPVTRHHDPEEFGEGSVDAGRRQTAADNLLMQTPTIAVQDIKVLDRETMVEVPPDGKTVGEVMIKGNAVMKGRSIYAYGLNHCR
jgi:fatty-acyl-CoA synthase